MRQMKPESARALTWFAAILMVVGWLVMSPGGAFLLFVLSALFAVAPAIFGATKIRLAALALLIMAIFFAVETGIPGSRMNKKDSAGTRLVFSKCYI